MPGCERLAIQDGFIWLGVLVLAFIVALIIGNRVGELRVDNEWRRVCRDQTEHNITLPEDDVCFGRN